MISYDELKNRLSTNLAGPLPGIEVQKKMMAYSESNLRFDMNSRDGARESGVLILFYPDQNDWLFPMILRHDYGGTHSGQVSLPGGRKEVEDMDIIETALREAEEEIGIDRKHVEVLGQLTELFIPVSNHLVFPVIGISPSRPELIPEEREVSKILHGSISGLLNPDTVKETTINIRSYRIKAPYFDFENEIVWGATAMMLSELKAII